jgi:hypothetical protein
MNKETSIATILFILCLIIGGYQTIPLEEKCSNNQECLTQLALEFSSVNYCLITNQSKDSCIYTLISSTKNPEFCNNTTNSSECYYKQAFYLDNFSLCKKTTLNLQCEVSFSINKNNSSLCEQSSDPKRCEISFKTYKENN